MFYFQSVFNIVADVAHHSAVFQVVLCALGGVELV